MHQSKKGNQWYFGMKVHAGVDAGSGYVHTITGTAGNVHDVTETPNLVRTGSYMGIPGIWTPLAGSIRTVRNIISQKWNFGSTPIHPA